jgi:retron-type reverse transcriptase
MSSFQLELSRNFDKPLYEIFNFARYASRRYKIYFIPKRSGGKRQISQPSAELKKYQRYIKSRVFDNLPIHDAVYSYRNDRNIKMMASQHRGARYLLRVDFADFFPSIQDTHIRHYFQNNQNLNNQDITLINLLVCKAGKLTIGAPSSPVISNFILYELDQYLDTKSKELDVTYTRYADDLYFSTSRETVLSNIIPLLTKFIKESFFIKLNINSSKTVNTSKKYSQRVTGLVLTTNHGITVGKKKKRYIKSLIFQYTKDVLDIEKEKYLKGFLSYIYSIEPDYISNLRKKYGSEIIYQLLPIKNFKLDINID